MHVLHWRGSFWFASSHISCRVARGSSAQHPPRGRGLSAKMRGQSRAAVRSAPYLIASHRSCEGLSVVTDTKAHRTTYGPLLYDA